MEYSLDIQLRNVLPIIQNRIMKQTTWFGEKSLKNPLDFWVYQEIIYEQRPDIILEIGNRYGGTTLAFAHLLDLLGKGRVIGVDIQHDNIGKKTRDHPRISLIEGDACEKFPLIMENIDGNEKILIIEDSSHTYQNTLNVLKTYRDLIPVGGYFIVEDSICHHGLDIGPAPGPYEAVETFISEDDRFIIDRSRESFMITWNPKGFLKRVR